MNRERLLKLAAHLRSDKRHHATFDIKHYSCGTSGCAIGELPALFPEDWFWDTHCIPSLIGIVGLPILHVCDFFDIDSGAACHLFTYGHQNPEKFGGAHYSLSCTAEDVADNIEALCAQTVS